jgi:hypothetical protein
MKLTGVENLVNGGHYVLSNAGLYIPISQDINSNYFLKFDGESHQLQHVATLDQIQSFDEATFRSSRDIYKTRFLQKALDDQKIKFSHNSEAVFGANFLLRQVLPYLYDSFSELERSLGIVAQTRREGKDIVSEITAKYSKNTEEKVFTITDFEDETQQPNLDVLVYQNHKPHQFLQTVVGQIPFLYITPKQVWRAVKTDTERAGLLHIGSHNEPTELYFFENHKMTCNVLSDIQRLLEHNLKQDAIRDFLIIQDAKIQSATEKQVQENQPTEFDIETFANQTEFEYESFGWKRKHDSFYIYWKMPKFAMRNPIRTDVYHPFPETKIGLRIDFSNNTPYPQHACIIDKMIHPFLRNWESDYEKICILSGFDTAKREPHDILNSLSTAVNAFTNGLTIKSIKDHGSENETATYFGRPLMSVWEKVGELTREQALEQQFLITNEWHILEAKK